MKKGKMLYIRVANSALEDMFKAGIRRDLLQKESSLALICEALLEWAAAAAAHGKEAEAVLEQRAYSREYKKKQTERFIGENGDLERVLEEVEQTKQEVISREEKRRQIEAAIKDYFKKEGEENA